MSTVADTGVRTRTIVVGVIGDRWAGSLAYALQAALAEAARVRIVRVDVAEPSRRAVLHLPLHVVEATGDPVQVLLDEGCGADLLVVECAAGDAAALADRVLTEVRRHTETLLVEVDADGEILRASGAAGWTYAAKPDLTFAMPRAPRVDGSVICVGVDASPASHAAVRWAAMLADRVGSTLTLVSVHDESGGDGRRSRSDAERDVAAASDLVGGPRPSSWIGHGEPAQCLLDASRGASMLVLGRHGTRGLLHSALGSVGDTCARLADCPVVIVPAT